MAAKLAALTNATTGVPDAATAAAAHATHISPIVLHLRPGVREAFMSWLETVHPGLVCRYRARYRGSTAPKAYRDDIGDLVARARTAA